MVGRRARWLTVLVASIVVAACGASPSPTRSVATTPRASTTPVASAEGAAAELVRLLERLERDHPEPFHAISREAWVAELNTLAGRVNELSPQEAEVELMRVVALLSREGRDGHQFALPLEDAEGPVLPIRVYEFAEGLFVTAAAEPYGELVGSRIVALAGQPIAEVLDALEPLVPRDGPATVPAFRPVFLLRTSVLQGLGLAGDGDVELTVVDAGGQQRTVALAPIPFAAYLEWAPGRGMIHLPASESALYLEDRGDTFWTEYLASARTLYVRYTEVRDISPADLEAFSEHAAGADVDRVVLDLRQNPGGDNHNYPPLLRALQDPGIDVPGRLFVLIDRVTFSAASNFATEIEQTTSATFVGEPMGGGLNFWNDVDRLILDDWPVPMQVGISTRYWEMATPDDPRLTIEPDIAVPVRAADHFAGRDPALEAVLTAPTP